MLLSIKIFNLILLSHLALLYLLQLSKLVLLKVIFLLQLSNTKHHST